MENCLVTKLKAVVDNDNLQKLGKITFDVPYVEGSGPSYLEYKGSVGIHVTCDKNVLTAGSIVIPTNDITARNSDICIENVVGGCRITIENVYDLVGKLAIGYTHPDPDNKLKLALNSQFVSLFGANITGLNYGGMAAGDGYKPLIDAMVKKTWNNVQYIALPFGSYGDINIQEAFEYYAARNLKVIIPSLAIPGVTIGNPMYKLSPAIKNTGLQFIVIREESSFENLPVSDLRILGIAYCSGTLESLVSRLIAAGRDSGCLQIRLYSNTPTSITLGGVTLPEWLSSHSITAGNVWVTWESGGTNIALTATQPGTWVSALSWGGV